MHALSYLAYQCIEKDRYAPYITANQVFRGPSVMNEDHTLHTHIHYLHFLAPILMPFAYFITL